MSHTEGMPSRRRLLAGATAVLAAGAAIATAARATPVASPGGAGADAELIRLCQEAQRLEERVWEIDRYGTSEEDCTKVTTAWDAVYEAIIDVPATTLAGIKAKARTLHAATFREAVWSNGFDDYLDNPSAVGDYLGIDGRIARSLCADVLQLQEAVA